MSSREAILAALRRNAPPATPAPELAGLGVSFDDPLAQLERATTLAGGTLVRVPTLAAASTALASLVEPGSAARQIVSLVPGVGSTTLELAAITDPHALADLWLVILPGAFAVAENAAVWVDTQALPHRALFVIPDHLALIVPTAAVVHDMHAAYARLAGRAPGHGVFLSGPSKTADIEQALVIGAQGARTCTLVLVDAL